MTNHVSSNDREPAPSNTGIFLLTRPAYYFGYGIESDPDIMRTIVGNPEIPFRTGMVAMNAALFRQEIDQVPDWPLESLGGKSVQSALSETWAKVTDKPFASDVLRKSLNRSDYVHGTTYVLGLKEVERLLAFNYAHDWRTWLYGLDVPGHKVSFETLTIGKDQEVDRAITNPEDKFPMGELATRQIVQNFADFMNDNG